MNYSYHTLENGIKLIHKNTTSYVAHLGLIINTGSRDEAVDEQGIAHFIEHTIFKGTKKRKSYHILSSLENVGGELNAFTSKEETCIHASFLNQYYQRTLELFSDIFINSTFPDKEIKKEKDVVIEEINYYKDLPDENIFDDFEALLFKNHELGRNILGLPSVIKTFNRKKIRKFIDANYNTDQMIICSVGNIDFNKLKAFAERYFSEIKSNPRTAKRKKFRNYKPFSVTLEKNTIQTHCIIGNISFSYKDKRRTEMILMNNLLGGPGMNTRLNIALREKHGISYNIESNFVPFSDTGIFNIYLGTDNHSIERAIELVNKELLLLREKKLGSLQLQRAKQQLMGQIAISYESNLTEMLSIGKSYLVYNKVDTLEQVYREIESITSDDIIELANWVFCEDKLSTLIYKPAK
jgi:predicted Zn-dependent peptidase